MVEYVLETHDWQVTVLGHGAARVGHEYRTSSVTCYSSSAVGNVLLANRRSVVSWATDQGATRKLAGAAYLESGLADLNSWLERLRVAHLWLRRAQHVVARRRLWSIAAWWPGWGT